MSDAYRHTIQQLIHTAHWLTDQLRQTLKSFGITEPQYQVLCVLSGTHGQALTVQDILEKMRRPNSNVTRLVDKLVLKGYVLRQECAANRRKMDIRITPKGKKALGKMHQKVTAFYQEIRSNLNEEELLVLQNMILKLKGNLHE